MPVFPSAMSDSEAPFGVSLFNPKIEEFERGQDPFHQIFPSDRFDVNGMRLWGWASQNLSRFRRC